MTKLRSIVCLGATVLLFGCKAGVKATTPGSGGGGGSSGPGTGGSTGTGGNTGAGGSVPHFDADFDVATDGPVDGICKSDETPAEPAPLDLYVLVDLSKTMGLTLPSTTTTKWDAVRSAMDAFFSSPQSVGLGAGMGYFPVVQPSLVSIATCTIDGPCGTFGPCDRRKTCVQMGSSTTVPVPLCLSNASCAANQVCALIQQCGGTTSTNYCAKDGAGTCAANCAEFPGYCHARDICDVATYATPVVPIAPLAGMAGQAATLKTALDARSPDGFTPTAPALKGAIQYARQYAQANAGHKVAVILVTDGLPLGFTDTFDSSTGLITPGFPRTECNPIDIPGIAMIAMAGAVPPASTPPTPAIPTFVVGVASQAELGVIGPMLNQIATGGGTAPAIQIDTGQDVSQILQTRLAEIRTKVFACEYKLPTSGVDFMKVNVTFESASGAMSTIGHTMLDGTNGAGCDARGGWYYDKVPNPGAGVFPTKITACPVTCSMFQTDLNGKVRIQLGCPTRPVD